MSAGSSSNGGGTPGRRTFFNDRRFTVAGPQRLRQNVQDLLSQVNRQFVADNPQLLHELADQLNRLQDLLSAGPAGNNATAGAMNQNANIPGTAVPVRQFVAPANGNNDVRQLNSPTEGAPSNSQHRHDSGTDAEAQYIPSDDEDHDNAINSEGTTQPNVGALNASVVLNMEIDNDGNDQGLLPTENAHEPDAALQGQEQLQQDAAGQAPGPNADVDWQRLVASLRAPEMQRVIKMITNFGPFLFILLLKWMLIYATSITTLIVLVATFMYVESVVETVVASSRTQNAPKWRLLFTILLMALNVGALYYFFSDEHLYFALLFQPTQPILDDVKGDFSFMTLLWLVVTTDIVAKFFFVTAKCLVVSGPALVAGRRKKAQTYQWLEYTSHVYRHWLPTIPWSYYLTATAPGSGFIYNGLCTLLFLAYLLLKVKLFRPKLSRWWRSTVSMLRPTTFGFRPSTAELTKIGPTCSICYGEFTNPVQLSCNHIFCDECVMTWLDKQKTCPMCRTQVITGDNDWKDGRTSYCIQFV